MFACRVVAAKFRAFAESGDTLGEGPFPLVEAFAERKP
jgi:hypothetical protein